jgi:RNase adaptor protein for sRNA GlmZ degradation
LSHTRGTLPVERERGTVYALLEALTDERTPADQPADRKDALITTLTQQIEDLREQVRSERQAHAEAMSLLAVALEPIRARRPGERRAGYGRTHPSDSEP